MLFNKNQQIIASWQSNNTGNDLKFQHQPLVYNDGEIDDLTMLKPEFTSIPNILTPNISREKFLDNHAHLATYNHLLKLNSDTELKINGSFFHDNNDNIQSVITKYFLDDSTYTVSEQQHNNLYRNSLITNVTLTRNIPSFYLENQLSFARFGDEDAAQIVNFDMQRINAGLHHQTLSNNFELLIPLKKNFLQIKSVFDVNQSPQQLHFEPGVFSLVSEEEGNTSQQIQNRNVITRNAAKFGFSFGNFILSSSLGLNYEKQTHETTIKNNGLIMDTDSLKNLLKWNKTTIEANEEVEYKKKGLVLNIGFPLKYIILDVNDKIHNAGNKSSNLFCNPFISVSYKPSGYITGSLSANYAKSLSDPNNLTQGNILISHRLIRKNDIKTNLINSISYQTKVTYRNTLTGLFGTTSWEESINSKDFLVNQISNKDGTFLYQTLRKDNQTYLRNLSSEITWFINDLKTTFGIKGRYHQTAADYLLNGHLSKMEQKQYELIPKILFNREKYWSADYSFHFSKTLLQLHQPTSNIIENEHSLNFFFYPNVQHTVGFETEYYISKRNNEKTVRSLFSNIVYRFSPVDKRINLRLQFRNIFNTHKIVNTRESDFAFIQTEYTLRPREFLITISWSLSSLAR